MYSNYWKIISSSFILWTKWRHWLLGLSKYQVFGFCMFSNLLVEWTLYKKNIFHNRQNGTIKTWYCDFIILDSLLKCAWTLNMKWHNHICIIVLDVDSLEDGYSRIWPNTEGISIIVIYLIIKRKGVTLSSWNRNENEGT